MEYFGHYRSSTTGTTGCVKEFITVGAGACMFQPQVSYYCDLCKKEHGFRYARAHMVATPSQRKSLERYCKEHGIEDAVALT